MQLRTYSIWLMSFLVMLMPLFRDLLIMEIGEEHPKGLSQKALLVFPTSRGTCSSGNEAWLAEFGIGDSRLVQPEGL
jgi:hypothetical protein